MRLLNTSTLEFKEFLGDKIPAYAILSHVWSDEEVSYDDYLARGRGEGHGYRKIRKLCELAKDLLSPSISLEWAWIDTCCIDKRSSAELTEAINSMFKWYKNAHVCFVFLPDVHHLSDESTESPLGADVNGVPFSHDDFLGSRWFTRGWTLQELLAPNTVLFFNTAFEILGSKSQLATFRELERIIAKASGIDEIAMSAFALDTVDFCIAQKMSWAARRQTTREEDLAYCLLGLFDVNMPLLYGEGFANAFLRLQSEIMARSNDDSIFAWDVLECESLPNIERPWSGMLAPSPRNFVNGGKVRQMRITKKLLRSRASQKPVHTISSRGVEISVPASPLILRDKRSFQGLIHPLSCEREGYGRIYLKIWVEKATLAANYSDNAKRAWRSAVLP